MQTNNTTKKFTITKPLVDDIIHRLSFGLTKGLGRNAPGQMCVEALICVALNEPFSDEPSCVLNELRKAKISLNDCKWTSKEARAKGMQKLAIAQLGSNILDEALFKEKLKLTSRKRLLPYIIQKHYEKTKKEGLLEYKIKFENLETLDNNLWKEFLNYYYDDYNDYYDYYDNNYDYNYYYYYYYSDTWLLLIADTILQVLVEMKSPGCEWLYLIDKNN